MSEGPFGTSSRSVCLQFIAITGACILFLGATMESHAAENFQVFDPPHPAPPIEFVDETGGKLSLDSYRGLIVVLNFWATWCAPCIAEMPSLDRLAGKLQEKLVKVVTLSQDRGGMAVAGPFLDELGVENVDRVADPKGLTQRAFGMRGLPTTFIISAQGEVLARMEGPADWDDSSMVDYISSLTER